MYSVGKKLGLLSVFVKCREDVRLEVALPNLSISVQCRYEVRILSVFVLCMKLITLEVDFPNLSMFVHCGKEVTILSVFVLCRKLITLEVDFARPKYVRTLWERSYDPKCLCT